VSVSTKRGTSTDRRPACHLGQCPAPQCRQTDHHCTSSRFTSTRSRPRHSLPSASRLWRSYCARTARFRGHGPWVLTEMATFW